MSTAPKPSQRPPRTFDEQLWPINVALLVLFGFVGGCVVALSEFTDPRLFHNGWVRLISLAISVGALMWFATRLNSRLIRRGLQLATILSLLTHLVLMVILYNQRAKYVAQLAEATDEAQEVDEENLDPRFTVPDYYIKSPEAPEQEVYERPVETAPPAETPQAPLEREQPKAELPPDRTPPTPEPDAKASPAVQPNQIEMRIPEQVAPRRANQTSKLSRQVARTNPRSGEAIPEPTQEVQRDEVAAVEARPTQTVRQRPTETPTDRQITDPGPTRPAEQQTVEIVRRDTPDRSPPKSSSAPTLTRRVGRQPAAVPRVEADTVAALGETKTDSPAAVQPRANVSRQQAGGLRVAMQPSPEPKPSAGPVVSARPDVASMAASRGGDNPRLTNRSLPTPGRSRRSTEVSAVAGDEVASTSPKGDPGSGPGQAGGQGDPQLAPAAMAVTRTRTASPGVGGPGAAAGGSEPGSAPQPGSVAGAQIQRAPAGGEPSLNPSAAPSPRVARALQAGRTVASPRGSGEGAIAGEGSAVAAGQPGGNGSARGTAAETVGPGEPSRTALTKGRAGAPAGIAGGPGLDSGLPGAPSSAPVAAVAMSREAGQGGGPGTGGASGPGAGGGPAGRGRPVGASRSIAGASLAMGSASAQDLGGVGGGGTSGTGGAGGGDGGGGNGSGSGGGAAGGLVDASSVASVRRGTSSGPAGALAAAGGGGGGVEIGPSPVAASVGTSRAVSGGGDPTVKVSTQGAPLAKSRAGGVAVASLGTGAVALVPEAPPGDGGGSGAGGGSGGGGSGGDAVQAIGPGGGALAAARAAGGGGMPVAMPGLTSGEPGGGGALGAGGGGGYVPGAQIARATVGGDGNGPGVASTGRGLGPSRAIGRGFLAETQAELPELSSGPDVGDVAAETSMPGAGMKDVRGSAGLPGKATTGAVGAMAGEVAIDAPIVGTPGNGIARQASGNEDGPKVGAVALGGKLKKTTVAGIPGGAGAPIDEPELDGTAASGTGDQGEPTALAGGEGGSLTRKAGGLPVQVAAADGVGGLGLEFTPEVGSLSRRAQRDSQVVHGGTARFIGRKAGGPLEIDGMAKEASEAFARRGGKQMAKRGGGLGMPAARTEDAVEAGLDFLARHQEEDGSWSLHEFGQGRPGYEKEEAIFESNTAATGLCLLTFFGAGYDHFDDQYRAVVRGGIDYLLKNQKPNGDLFVSVDKESNKSAWFYSHGIATIALCEAYGMTGDESLKEPAQKALNFITASQHPSDGGWRYLPQLGSDTSVSGWQLMALKSGELAGLQVPRKTFDNVTKWLNQAQAAKNDGSQYVYNPQAMKAEQLHGRKPTPAMTAVGLLMRMYTGWNRNDPQMIKGADYLLTQLPAIGTPKQPLRDTYYWYYATQVMFHMQGAHWQKWNEQLHPLLVERQIKTGPMAGSWDPLGPVPDRWGPQAGRLYVTTMNLLSLEVYYRHLPIYESTAK